MKAPPDQGASSFVYPPTGPNLEFFAKALQSGCLVAIPTETVYGLAGLALNEEACRSIFAVKGRPLMDPLIVHIPNRSMAGELAELPDCFQLITDRFWPGPLTLILKKKPIVPDMITAGKPTVAIRMPRHPVAQELLKKVGAPLAAPSANPFGYISPSTAKHVVESFGENVPFILDGGHCKIGLESTILDLSDPEAPQILRPGAIFAEEISDILRVPVVSNKVRLEENQAAKAPGTFSRHYSPETNLSLFEKENPPVIQKDHAIVFLDRPGNLLNKNVFWLSEDGSLEKAAQSLFGLLRKLDRLDYSVIHCELPTIDSGGYAEAIRDRLSRAAAK